jgi:hypothetical protein
MDHGARGFRLGHAAVAGLFILVFAFISFSAILQKSLTFDEPLHLYAGYSYLKWGDFRINTEHPPLVKILAALPLMAVELKTGEITQAQRDLIQLNKDYGWELANQFIYANRDNQHFLLYPKLVMIGLAALLGLFVFLWARDIYGLHAAFAALVLYCLDPNILAHSSIIHTDLPFALFFFAGTYFFWLLLNGFRWMRLFAACLCFALSSITKFSFLVITPVWLMLGAIHLFSFQSLQTAVGSPSGISLRWQKASLVGIILAAALTMDYFFIRGLYQFGLNAVAQHNEHWSVDHLMIKNTWIEKAWLINLKYALLPQAWLYGLADTLTLFDRSSYLYGEVSKHGFWLYFPVAFALKTPLPTLALSAVGLMLIIVRRRVSLADIFVLVPAMIFFGVAVCSRLNIGLRHILPIYPFLFVWLGGVASAIWKDGKEIGRCSVLLLGFWLMLSSVRNYPDYLAFFNELAGGPKNGHVFLVDSNLDWGQDLKGLKTWMDRYKIDNIRLAYFGTMNPAFYGINAVPAPGSLSFLWKIGEEDAVVSPYIAISATYLAGLYLPRPDTYVAFRNKRPVASIGNSILIYRLDENP